MLISQHLKKEMVSVDLKGCNLQAVMSELADLIIQGAGGLNAKAIRDELIRREKLMSTAAGHGLAFPHCYTRVRTPMFAIGVSRSGIDVESPDGKPVHIFVAVISPERKPDSHLDALAAASHVFIEPTVRERIMNAANPKEVMTIIAETEHDGHG